MNKELVLEKKCKFCQKSFIAKRTTTRYCSLTCNSRDYKKKKRGERQKQHEHIVESQNTYGKRINHIRQKEVLSITEVAIYLGVSRPTVYNYLDNKELKHTRLGGRILIKRADIDNLFTATEPIYRAKPNIEQNTINEYYTIENVKEKFNVKDRWIFKVVKDNNIPKILHKGRSYISKQHIDKYFSKQNTGNEGIDIWYTISEIQDKYEMTPSAIYSYVHDKNIPKKKDGRNVLYSKIHFDETRKNKSIIEKDYYNTEEAMKTFDLTRDALYYYISYHKLPKITIGRNVRVLRSALNQLFNKNILS